MKNQVTTRGTVSLSLVPMFSSIIIRGKAEPYMKNDFFFVCFGPMDWIAFTELSQSSDTDLSRSRPKSYKLIKKIQICKCIEMLKQKKNVLNYDCLKLHLQNDGECHSSSLVRKILLQPLKHQNIIHHYWFWFQNGKGVFWSSSLCFTCSELEGRWSLFPAVSPHISLYLWLWAVWPRSLSSPVHPHSCSSVRAGEPLHWLFFGYSVPASSF